MFFFPFCSSDTVYMAADTPATSTGRLTIYKLTSDLKRGISKYFVVFMDEFFATSFCFFLRQMIL